MKKDNSTDEGIDLNDLFNKPLKPELPPARRRAWVTEGAIGLLIILALLARWGWMTSDRLQQLQTKATTDRAAQLALQANVKTAQAQQQANLRATAQAAQTAQAGAEKHANTALARQLGAQAKSLLETNDPAQETAVLLAVESTRLHPNVDASRVLQENTLGLPVFHNNQGHGATSVAFSPDGRSLIAGGVDGIARIWSVDGWREISHMESQRPITQVTFTGDGKYAVLGDEGGTAIVWDPLTWREIWRLRDAYGISQSANGRYLASYSRDGLTASVFDMLYGQEVARTTIPPDDKISSLAFSPQDRYVATGNNSGAVMVWEALTGKTVLSTSMDKRIVSVAISPDETFVAAGSLGGTIKVWEIASGQETSRMINDARIETLTYSPDGNYLVSGSQTAKVWEARTGKEISHMAHAYFLTTAEFSPDGRLVLTAGCGFGQYQIDLCNPNVAKVWEAATGKEVSRLPVAGEISDAAFSPDGKYAAVASPEEGVTVWEPEKRQGAARLAYENNPNVVAFSSNGAYLASSECDHMNQNSGCDQSTVSVWDPKTGQEISRMAYQGEVNAVAVNRDGSAVISGGCEIMGDSAACTQATVNIWRAQTGKEVNRIVIKGMVNKAIFSPDGKSVVLLTQYPSAAIVMEALTGREVMHVADAISVDLSRDGRLLATRQK